MNYITDYQLEKEGFQCKINDEWFDCPFRYSGNNKQYYVSGILKVADAIGVDRNEFIGIFNSKHAYNVIFCKSKNLCYELCQHIVKTYFKPTQTDKKEWREKSRRYLAKYYNSTQNIVMFPNKNFYLDKWNNEGHWFWRNTTIGSHTLYEQFNLTKGQVLVICSNLNLSAYFHSNVLIFESTTDAIKFTDYLIETYIIKKEKTYDTNQLRKERATISGGAKPAGSIIHGRRSKASIRRGCIKHQTCIGS